MPWSLIFSVLVGIAAWFATHFVGRPLLKAYEYREKAHELIFYTGNIGSISDSKELEDAAKELRRLAAQIGALAANMPFFYHRILGWFGINLVGAARGLTGLSNSLATKDGSKATHRNQVEKALNLPTT